VTQQTTAALEEISGAMQQVVDLTNALATLNACFTTLFNALESAQVDKTARAAGAELEAVNANA
jgi:hypothetical protein